METGENAVLGFGVDSREAEAGSKRVVRSLADIREAAERTGRTARSVPDAFQRAFAESRSSVTVSAQQMQAALRQTNGDLNAAAAVLARTAAQQTQVAATTQAVGVAATRAYPAIGQLRGAFTTLASTAVGMNPALGRLSGVLGSFAFGSPWMVGILAGIAAIGFAWNRLTRDADDLKKSTREAIKFFDELAKKRAGPIAEISGNAASIQAEIVRNEARIRSLRAASLAAATLTTDEGRPLGPEAIAETRKEYERLISVLEKVNAARRLNLETGKAEVRDLRTEAAEEAAREQKRLADERKAAGREAAQAEAAWRKEIVDAVEAQGDALSKVHAAGGAELLQMRQARDLLDLTAGTRARLAAQHRLDLETLQAETTLTGPALRARLDYVRALFAEEMATVRVIEQRERLNDALKGATALAEKNAAIIARQSAAVIAKAERDPLIEPFLEAARSMQRAFESAFRNILRDGKNIFAQLADSIVDVFIAMAASIAAVLTARALGIDRLIKYIQDSKTGISLRDVREKLGTAGQYAGAALAGAGVGYGVGASTGSATAGAISGGLAGAATGFALGGPPGAIIGAVVGIAAGIFGASQKIKEARKQFDEALKGFAEKWGEPTTAFATAFRQLTKDFADLEHAAYKAHTAVNAETRALYEAAQARIRSDFITSLDEALNALGGNSYQNAVDSATRAYKQNLETIRVLGLGIDATDKATRLYIETLEALRKAQERALGDLEGSIVDRLLGRAGLTRLVEDRQLARQHRDEIDQARSLGADPGYIKNIELAHEWERTMLAATRAYEDSVRKYEEQLRVQEEAVRALEQQVDATRRVVESLRDFRESLDVGPASPLSMLDRYTEAQRLFQDASTAAKGGDLVAAGRIPELGRQYLDLARDYFASGPGYAQAFDTVRTIVDALEGQFGTQLSTDEAALQAAKDQVAVTKLLLDTMHTDFEKQLQAQYAIYEAIRALPFILRDPSAIPTPTPTPTPVDGARLSMSPAYVSTSGGDGTAEIVARLETEIRVLQAGFEMLLQKLDVSIEEQKATTRETRNTRGALEGRQ
jgi:gas vesicle protein